MSTAKAPAAPSGRICEKDANLLTQVHITDVLSQRTRHQKLNSDRGQLYPHSHSTQSLKKPE